jgi:hypothetical protein
MDEEGCDCEKCKSKKKYRLEGIERVEKNLELEYKKNIYTMGVPKSKIKAIIEQSKEEVK